MKVKFRTNLGLRMASQLGLDSTQCLYESELDVSEEAASELVSSGIAEAVSIPETIKAVPDEPAIRGEDASPKSKSTKSKGSASE